jgi:tRNA A-37 threonylcarbamoyl transferase component Bud32
MLHNRYLVKSLIAQGSSGALYQATDTKHNHTVAVKQVLLKDMRLRKACELEARLILKFRHPSLPAVNHYFAEETGQFLVMQFVPGDSLGTLLERQQKKFLTATVLNWLLRWTDQLLDALGYLHKQTPPFIHRNIKPHNLKPTQRGDIMLLDFGLAKGIVPQSQGSAVSPYAPLEQLRGNSKESSKESGIDERCDVYSLAATMYYLMTAAPPPDAITRAAAVANGQPDPLVSAHDLNPLVPSGVALIIHQAMELNREYRFASTMAMRTALRMTHKAQKPAAGEGGAKGGGDGGSGENEEAGSSGLETIVSSEHAEQLAPPEAEPSAEPAEDEGTGTPALTAAAATVLPHPVVMVAQRDAQAQYTTITDAIAQAQPGTRIYVRPGIYREHVVIDKAVEIIGDGPVSHIVIENVGAPCIEMQTEYALVRRVRVQGRSDAKATRQSTYAAIDIAEGRLVLEECEITSDTLACIAIHNQEACPVLWQCKIYNQHGIGVLVYDQGQGMLEACDIFNAAVAGVRIIRGGNPVVRGCRVYDSEKAGIAVSEEGLGVIEACDIFDNQQAGIEITGEGNPLVRACKIHDQAKGVGIAIVAKGRGMIEACDIFGNQTAGIHISQHGHPFIRRCQIHHEKHAGVLVVESGMGTLEECDIFGNTDAGVSIAQEGNPFIHQCQIHDSEHSGVKVWDEGTGTLDGCHIFANSHAGVEISQQGSNPVLRYCHITKNKMTAIHIYNNGGASVDECDLTGNTRGPWSVEESCMVLGTGNRE